MNDTNELDISWLNDFENTDNLYKDYYTDDLYYVNVNFIYINNENAIEKTKSGIFYMKTPNYIHREEIIGIIKKNSIDNNKKYSVLAMLKYNFTVEPNDIPFFLKNESSNKEDFLSSVTNFDAISFKKTIHMFHDLNELIILFYDKNINSYKEKDSNTYSNDSLYNNNLTKKIFIYSKNKKTIRKQYKD
jgi:hypothetical protein